MAANDINLLAAERLETAVERLAEALDAWRGARRREAAATQDMVPRAEVEGLSARLDDALVRLRQSMDEPEG